MSPLRKLILLPVLFFSLLFVNSPTAHALLQSGDENNAEFQPDERKLNAVAPEEKQSDGDTVLEIRHGAPLHPYVTQGEAHRFQNDVMKPAAEPDEARVVEILQGNRVKSLKERTILDRGKYVEVMPMNIYINEKFQNLDQRMRLLEGRITALEKGGTKPVAPSSPAVEPLPEKAKTQQV